MNDNVVVLDHFRQTFDDGNGAYQALLEVIGEYSDAVENGDIHDIVNIIIGQLWSFGYKIVPLDEEDLDDTA